MAGRIIELVWSTEVYAILSVPIIYVPVTQYNDVIMGAMASQITSLAIVYSTSYSGADQRKHQSSAWLAFKRGIHRWPVNSPHKWPVTRIMFPFDDVIMCCGNIRLTRPASYIYYLWLDANCFTHFRNTQTGVIFWFINCHVAPSESKSVACWLKYLKD